MTSPMNQVTGYAAGDENHQRKRNLQHDPTLTLSADHRRMLDFVQLF
jgi:hypothetical protein